MSSRINGPAQPSGLAQPSGTASVSSPATNAPKKPDGKPTASALNPELAPSLAVLASIAALPPPEQALSDAEPLLALESSLGAPTGEKVGDPFAHEWIPALAEKARA